MKFPMRKVHYPPLAEDVLQHESFFKWGWTIKMNRITAGENMQSFINDDDTSMKFPMRKVHYPPLAGEVLQHESFFKWGWTIKMNRITAGDKMQSFINDDDTSMKFPMRNVHYPPLAGEVLQHESFFKWGWT